MKRIISLILVLVTLLSCFCVPIFAYENYVGLDKPLHKTTVEEDLENAGFDFDTWLNNGNFDDYVEVLFTREYGYTKDGAALLYFYVYIDPGIYEVFPGAVHDTFEFEIANKLDENGNPISYITRSADLVDYSEDKRFYKYCARDLGGFEWEDGRLYYIGDVEVYQNGDELCKYETSMRGTVNRAFYYKGNDDLNTLNCEVFQDNIIDLRTKPTVYRTLSSDKGLGYSYDIFSVYFSVPNEYFEKYDYLRAISYKYFEQLWNAVVVDDDDIYAQVNSMLNVDFSAGFNSEYASIYANYYRNGSQSEGTIEHRCDYSINDGGIGTLFAETVYEDKAVVNQLLNAFQVEDWTDDDIFISGKNITDFFDHTETGEKANWFYGSTTLDDTFDIKSFSGNDPNLITKFYAWLNGYNKGHETELSNVIPIVTFEDSKAFDGYIEGSNDENYANEHLINKRDIADFVSTVRTATSNNETVVLFRFAVRDYYSRNAVVYERDFVELADENGFYAQGTGFNKFNIISLTFRKANQDFIVNVNDDPQDINGGITGPVDTLRDDLNETVDGFFEGVVKWFDDFGDEVSLKFEKLALLLGGIAVLVAVCFLVKLIAKNFEKQKKE